MKLLPLLRFRWHNLCLLVVIFCALHACTAEKTDSHALFEQGKAYEQLNLPDSALLCYREALQQAITETDTSHICQLLNATGQLFYNHLVYDKAIKTFYKQLEYARLLTDKSHASEALRGIGRCHYVRQEYEQALKWFLQAESLIPSISDSEERSSVYNNLANAYIETGHYEKALACCNQALRLTTDSAKIYRDFSVKARSFTLLQQHDSALYYLRIAANSNNPRTQASVYFKLASLPNISGISDSLKYVYLKKGQLLSDSIESNNQPVQLTESYVLASMEELEGKSRYRLLWTGALVLVILGITVTFIYRHYQHRLRVHRHKIDHLMAANQELKTEMERNQEINQLGLLRNTCETCQRHFCQTPAYQELKKNLQEDGFQLSYKAQDLLQTRLQEAYAPFITLLVQSVSLSSNDLTLCCLVLSHFNTKECAACRGVSNETIRSQKTRIKRKLQESPLGDELFRLIFSD